MTDHPGQRTVAGEGPGRGSFVYPQDVHAAAMIFPLPIGSIPGTGIRTDCTGHGLVSDVQFPDQFSRISLPAIQEQADGVSYQEPVALPIFRTAASSTRWSD